MESDKLLDMVWHSKPEDLVEFLREELAKNKSIDARFQARFAEKAPKVSRETIDRMYVEAGGRQGWIEEFNNIDFDPITSIAEIMKERCDYAGAADVYRELADAIADHMDMVDDSDAHYATEFEIILDEMVSCINQKEITRDEKRAHMRYLADRCKKNEPDFFTDYFSEALNSICANDEDRKYKDDLLSKTRV